MKIFLTGATGFIGSALIPELIAAGHQVLGLTRSESGARVLAAAGAVSHLGDLRDIDSLRRCAKVSDAVIHCAYSHDFSKPDDIGRMEAGAIETLGNELAGTDRPLVITSVTGMGAETPGQPATEGGYNPRNPRSTTEQACQAIRERGANVSIVRLAQVHNHIKQGLVSALVDIARAKGVSAYIGDGSNRWSAVHLLDAVTLYRLALEKAKPGSVLLIFTEN
ncbi:NAD-dependent epimerase/dehydratase family protein [Komagataeibacter oboediens]|uniref:NAD-dependent epimerase/dehydratase family protein n=1 Tax=Komagataeibacter oboediens TaxID=65958 RepID=UPI001C2DE82E|nr:NAD-dependent epimerase/dehydratase family protein [Komagataeibacter oboediens]MBV1825727.1 NAD-dependent epimerase/dehydratase family protein [Komagataeibacter oboediens]